MFQYYFNYSNYSSITPPKYIRCGVFEHFS